MKRKLMITLIFILTFFVGWSFFQPEENQEDTYIIESEGYNGMIELAVRFYDKKIQSIEVLSHHESPGVSDPAILSLPNEIIENQSIAIDTKSGVTITSNAIISGVEHAIIKAGLKLEDFRKIPVKNQNKETIIIEKDAVIIGSGGAGCAAAATIASKGGSLVMIEKMPYYGGNTLQAAGTMNAVDPVRQQRQQIEDSVDLYIQQTYEYGGQKGDLKLIETLANNALSARNWLSTFGGKWSEKIYQTIGGLWPRSMDPQTYGDTKNMYLDPLLNTVLENPENELLLNLKAVSLIEENGVIVGVKAEAVHEPKEYLLYGRKGVLIATGGYSANLTMINLFNSDIPLNTSNHLGATGDGLLLAQQVNAALTGMDSIQIHPHGNPQTGRLQSEIAGDVTDSIYVNMNGERFVNEQGTWQEISQAVLNQPNKIMYSIYDGKQNIPNKGEAILDYRLIEAATIEELALKLGIDPNKLSETVNLYNVMIASDLSDPFGKHLGQPINSSPYYACLLTPVYHYTMGGIKINEKAEVISVSNQVIPHLYAAGEVTGGIHGDNRLGGNSMSDIVVFGRIAGEQIMNNK